MSYRNRSFVLSCLLCLQLFCGFTLPLAAQAAASNRSGLVIDGAGQPLANMELVVLQQQPVDQAPSHGQEVARVVTDSQGRYTVSVPVTGTYALDLSEATRRLAVNEIIIVADQAANVLSAQATAQAELAGTVTDAKGKPAKQVAVSLYTLITQNGYNFEQLIRRTLTDDQGRYRFRDLPSGQYKLGISDVNYPERYVGEFYDDGQDLWQATPIDLAASPRQIDVQLALAGVIAGRVTDQAGQPLAGIRVAVYYDSYGNWQLSKETTTLADGSYSVTGLGAGDYRIGYRDSQWPMRYAPEFHNDANAVESATTIPLAAGATVKGIVTQLATASQIVGTVTDQDGLPIERIMISLFHDPAGNGNWQPANFSGHTDFGGAYQITGLPAGIYRLVFMDMMMMWPARYHAEFYNNAATLETATDLTVGAGVIVSGIDAQLLATSHIQGQVTADNGQPLVKAPVYLFQSNGDGNWYEMNRAVTDEVGFYDLGGLAVGTYRIGFAYTDSDRPAVYYGNATHVKDATDIAVGPNATVTNINAQLPAPGVIAGVVSDEAGQPLVNISVRAWRQITSPMGMDTRTEWYPVNTALSTANGVYTLNNLAAGHYRLEFGDYNNMARRYSTEYYQNAATLAAATDITVTNGVTRSGIDAQLARTGAISGQVTDPAGQPVSNIVVAALYRLTDGLGNTFWAEAAAAMTDGLGAYTLTGVDAGSYRLVFRDSKQPARYATEYYNNVADREAAQEITVAANTLLTGINAQLATGSQINGQVTGEQNEAFANVTVVVFRAGLDAFGQPTWEHYGNSFTQNDGSYRVTGLSAGRYRVGFMPYVQNYQPEYYDNAASVEEATDLQVDGQQALTAINAQLTTQPILPVMPRAQNDRVTLNVASRQLSSQSGTLNLLTNDSDPNGDVLTAILVADAQYGTVSLQPDGTFQYTPKSQGVLSSDRFTYQVSDGQHRSNIATVEIELEITPTATPFRLWLTVIDK